MYRVGRVVGRVSRIEYVKRGGGDVELLGEGLDGKYTLARGFVC